MDTRATECVWDYPRPPVLEATRRLLVVEFDRRVIAQTREGLRVLETSHPPTYYFPPQSVEQSVLIPSPLETLCEFKGRARYWSLCSGERMSPHAAWYYPRPVERFAAIKDYIAFYPSRVDACYVDGERAVAQQGDYYGGWITGDVSGPLKGGPGSGDW